YLVGGGLCWASEGFARERYEVVGADDHLAAGFGRVADEVIGKDASPRRPVLGVEIPTVAGLELLYGLDCQQCGGVILGDQFVCGLCHCSSILVDQRSLKPRPARHFTRKL